MALGGVIPGMVFDITGTYTWAIILSAVFSLAGSVAILLLENTRRQLIPNWPEMESKPIGSEIMSVTTGSAEPGISGGD
jgi:hypothetical protein